jgi:hypothetical protein
MRIGYEHSEGKPEDDRDQLDDLSFEDRIILNWI